MSNGQYEVDDGTIRDLGNDYDDMSASFMALASYLQGEPDILGHDIVGDPVVPQLRQGLEPSSGILRDIAVAARALAENRVQDQDAAARITAYGEELVDDAVSSMPGGASAASGPH